MKIEVRSKNEVKILGYVNAVERRSAVLPKEKGHGAPGNFVEVIKQGAFGQSLTRRPDVKLKFNHDRVIGGTDSNLELREDSIGLHASAVVTDSEVVNAAKSGKLTGWSFGMTGIKSDWEKSENEEIYTRSITDMDLLEVSLLTVKPAYAATSVELRDGVPTEIREAESGVEISDEQLRKNQTTINVKRREIEILQLKGRRTT